MNGDVNNTEAYLAQFEAWLVEALASADQDEVVTSVVAVVGQLAERVAQAELRLALARAGREAVVRAHAPQRPGAGLSA